MILLKDSDLAEAFAEIEWDLPENKAQAGNIAIIAPGNKDMLAISESFAMANGPAAANIKVAAPQALQPFARAAGLDFTPLPSDKHGYISPEAMPHMRSLADWADQVILPGSSGHSSQSTLLLSKFIADCPVPITIAGQAAHIVVLDSWALKSSARPTLVCTFEVAQKLSLADDSLMPLVSSDNITKTTENTIATATAFSSDIIFMRPGQLIASIDGQAMVYNLGVEHNPEPTQWQPRLAGSLSALSAGKVKPSPKQLAAALHLTFKA